MTRTRLAILSTHPIQYYSPWFAHLARHMDLHVYYAHRQTAEGQAAAGFSTLFSWDLPLLEGYKSTFLTNVAKRPGLRSFLGCNTPEIGPIILRGGFDALLMFGWNKLSFVQAWVAALRAGVPVLIRLDSQLGSTRNVLKRVAKRPLYSLILPRTAYYLSPGERSDAYLKHYQVPSRRIHRLPHMVDVERFSAGANAARINGAAALLRASYGATSEDIVFLFVGKLIEKKRPLLLLEALAKMRRGSCVQLWMVGDGPLEQAVDAKIAAASLPVRRLGFVNQSKLPTVYAAADCLVLPSTDEETWGLVVNEAQACGLPVIVSTRAGCAPELVQEGVTGWTLRVDYSEQFAELLEHAVDRLHELPRQPIEALARANSYEEGTRQLMQILGDVAGRPTDISSRTLRPPAERYEPLR